MVSGAVTATTSAIGGGIGGAIASGSALAAPVVILSGLATGLAIGLASSVALYNYVLQRSPSSDGISNNIGAANDEDIISHTEKRLQDRSKDFEALEQAVIQLILSFLSTTQPSATLSAMPSLLGVPITEDYLSSSRPLNPPEQ